MKIDRARRDSQLCCRRFVAYPTVINLVLRSTDGGLTFTPADTGLSGLSLAMGIDPIQPSRLFVTVPGGLFRTQDGGTSWALLNPGGETSLRPLNQVLQINPKTPNLLYLGGASLLEVELKN